MCRRTIWRSSSSLWRASTWLQKRAWSAAIRSAHDDGPAALCLLLWSLFLAEDREGLRRAGRFHDDRGARRARFSHDRRLQEASSAAAGEAVFAGADAGGKSWRRRGSRDVFNGGTIIRPP